MKKLKKLSLNQISKADLEHREMNYLRGGCTIICTCACVGVSDAQSTMNSNDSSRTKDTVDTSKHHCACNTLDTCSDDDCPYKGGGY